MIGVENTNFDSKPERVKNPLFFLFDFLILKHSIYNNHKMEIML